MKNIIPLDIKIVDRPLVATRSKFPYNDVLHSLKNLDPTKAITFEENEINVGNIYMIKKLLIKYRIKGEFRHTRQGKKYIIWLNRG